MFKWLLRGSSGYLLDITLEQYRFRAHFIHFELFNTAALRNHIRIVFEEMSSWTALTWHTEMETVF